VFHHSQRFFHKKQLNIYLSHQDHIAPMLQIVPYAHSRITSLLSFAALTDTFPCISGTAYFHKPSSPLIMYMALHQPQTLCLCTSLWPILLPFYLPKQHYLSQQSSQQRHLGSVEAWHLSCSVPHKSCYEPTSVLPAPNASPTLYPSF
jgi:hypothetical protein